MEHYYYWLIVGIFLTILELVVPGGIIVFLGIAAMLVGSALYVGVIQTVASAFIAWFILSLILIMVLRSFFMQYFEGDTHVENVDERKDVIGSIVEVSEQVFPHKEGRVRFRATTWKARSDEELKVGSKVRVTSQDGSTLIVQSI